MGTLYAYMQYGFTPDIVTTAKGLAGGLPIGACMLGEKVQDTLKAGSHGSTFGGNLVSCAGALSVLSRLDDAAGNLMQGVYFYLVFYVMLMLINILEVF